MLQGSLHTSKDSKSPPVFQSIFQTPGKVNTALAVSLFNSAAAVSPAPRPVAVPDCHRQVAPWHGASDSESRPGDSGPNPSPWQCLGHGVLDGRLRVMSEPLPGSEARFPESEPLAVSDSGRSLCRCRSGRRLASGRGDDHPGTDTMAA